MRQIQNCHKIVKKNCQKIKRVKMAEYIKCDRCGKYGIEVLGDRELGCYYCLNEEDEEDLLSLDDLEGMGKIPK